MYKFLNVNPEGRKVGDCVKRAITTLTGKDYKEVSLELNRHKKITGCSKFNESKNWQSYVENVLGCTKISFPAVAGELRMNGERFCKSYPKGKYLLRMSGHLSVCIDGIIYDIWDCTQSCVYTAYKYDENKKSIINKDFLKKQYQDKIKALKQEIRELQNKLKELD